MRSLQKCAPSRFPRPGFSLLEVLIACFLLALALLQLLWMNRYSNEWAMDAYYRAMATSLAREPIVIFRGFGARWLRDYEKHQLPQYPLGWSPIREADGDLSMHPAESGVFQRNISLTNLEQAGSRGVRVTVTVVPEGGTRVMRWLRRDQLVLEALIPEGMP